MKKSIGAWQFWGFATTALGGTLLHFLYDWLGKKVWIAPFSGVNESTFEHMKLLFWPMFLFAILQSYFFSNSENFWCIKLRGILLGQLLIPVLFYTYNGAIAPSPDWLNIAIFFITAAISYIYETKKLRKKEVFCHYPLLAFLILLIIALFFFIFTFNTPRLGIFRDPLSETYGI